MADDIIGNGDKTWELLLKKMDETHVEVKESRKDIQHVDRRLTAVETGLDNRPCEVHNELLETLDERMDDIEKGQARGSRKWATLGNLAVAVTAIGAILWKIVG